MKMSNHKTNILRVSVFLIALIIVFSTMQLNLFASAVDIEETENIEEIDNIDNIDIEATTEAEEREGFYEVVELREEYSKHFHLSDGNYRAVTYTAPVHRKDESGAWQDIDNRLLLNTDEKGTSAYGTTDGRVTFAQGVADFTEGGIYTLSENGYTVSLSAVPNTEGGLGEMSSGNMTLQPVVGNPAATVTNHSLPEAVDDSESDAVKFEKASKIDNRSSITYEDVFTNTHLEYVLSANSIKENIIVNSPRASYAYSFLFTVSGLTAALNEDGSITLADSDTGDAVYYVPAPYMYDANDTVSYDVSYTLTTVRTGQYILTVTADSTWMNSTQRAFPVVIDPSLDTAYLQRPISDTYVSAANPGTNYGYDTKLWISSDKTTLVNVTMPVLPENRIIVNAEFYTYYYYYVDSGYMTVAAYEYLYPWNIMYADWNFLNEHDNLGVSTTASATAVMEASERIDADSPGEAVFDLTELVRKWYNGTSTNYGIALKHIPAQSTNDSVILVSCDADNADTYGSFYYIEYQLLDEGVYGLKNVGNDGLWMDIQYNSTKAGARVQQCVFSSGNPVTSFSRSGLFKVNFYGGMVHIRTMLNNELMIGVDSSAGVVRTQPAAISDANTAFEITPADEDGVYYIEWGPYVVCANNTTASGSAGAPDYYLTPKMKEEAGDQGKWEFVKYTGVEKKGVVMTSSASELFQFETFDYDAVMYSTNVHHNGPLTYSVTNTDGTETDKATINTVTGDFTALKTGSVKIRMTYSGSSTIWNYTVNITSSLEPIVEAVGQLDQYAQSYLPSGNRADRAYMVMSYIRIKGGINTGRYVDDLWDYAAGGGLLYNGYIDYVDSINPSLATIFTSNLSDIYDDEGNKIDFYHLNATLCALFYADSGLAIIGEDGKNLFGWAGDLQSLAGRVITYLEENDIEKSAENIYNYSRELLSSNETISPFSLSDLYSDVDAYNLYQLITNMQMESLDDYIEYYYDYNYNDRFSLFVSGLNYYEIKSIAYDYTFWLTVEMFQEDFHHLQIYQVDAIATAYADHIWTFIINEMEN